MNLDWLNHFKERRSEWMSTVWGIDRRIGSDRLTEDFYSEFYITHLQWSVDTLRERNNKVTRTMINSLIVILDGCQTLPERVQDFKSKLLKCIEFVDRVSNCIHNDPRIPSRTEDDQRRLIREIQICITMFDDDGSEIMGMY